MKTNTSLNQFLIAVTMLLLSNIFSANAFAITIDGSLNDWDVHPTSYGNFDQWTPKEGVIFTQEDQNPAIDFLSPGWGGQNFDVEAMYYTLEDSMAYFAVVTGFNLQAPPAGYLPGDFAIDFSADGTYEFGVETTGADKGKLYEFSNQNGWAKPLFTQSGPYAIKTNKIGTYLDYVGLTDFAFGTDYAFDKHYVFEIGIPVDLFGLYWDNKEAGKENPLFKIHWTMSCGNDALDLQIDPQDIPHSPEPVTTAMLISGLAVSGLTSLKKKKITVQK